ncbi:uncharacterized protein LOC126272391 [Schistocerca gregaria]|uniref:uncharacterized protein LOC126272391 n=1 Tax=Schistocerca gregaria TaxID=7010 RepID=UPI00211DB3BE|nr:uncharacterized protein LOC126272391 [Schistocerca gregaria]
MPRSEYDVQKGAPSPADTSFRSCVLAILIFIVLCLVFVLLAVLLRSSRAAEPRAVVAPAHKDSEKVNEQGRLNGILEEDIETLTDTTPSRRPATGTRQPAEARTEAAVVTERRAPSEDSKARTVGAGRTNTTTESPVTAATEGPVTPSAAATRESVARTTRNYTTLRTEGITQSSVVENATLPPTHTNTATTGPQPAPTSGETVVQTTLDHRSTLSDDVILSSLTEDVTHPPNRTNATTTFRPEPAPSSGESVAQSTHHRGSTPTENATLISVTENVTHTLSHTDTTTVRPQSPPIVFVSSPTSDIPTSYLPSSIFPIVVDRGPVKTTSKPHSTTPNGTTESLGPRVSDTDRLFLVFESANDSSTPANNVTGASPTPADRTETTTARTADEVVTTNASANESDRSGSRRLVESSSSEEQTTVVSVATSSGNASSGSDDGLLVARNDSSLTTRGSATTTTAEPNFSREGPTSAAHVESEAATPAPTTASTRRVSDNSSATTLTTNRYVVQHVVDSGSSAATSQREDGTVPTTTTETATTTNRTPAASSVDYALEPIVPTTRAPERNVCRTDACYRQAQRMAAMMNHTAPPCRGFYVTACGGLQADPLLQQYDPQKEAFRRIADVTRSSKELPSAIKKLREFEESCMQYDRQMGNEPRIAEVRKVMNNIGNFSFDNDEWKDFRSKFADLFSTLIKYNSSPLFDVLLDVESKNKPTFVFKLVPPLPGGSIFSGDRRTSDCWRSANQNSNKPEMDMDNKYLSYRNCTEDYEIFSNTVDLVKHLGYFNDADETAAAKFNESLTFALIDLHKYMKIPKEAKVRQEQFTKKFKPVKIAEMDEMFPLIDWKKLFMNLVDDYHESIGEQLVQIYSTEYFDYIFQDLADRAESEHPFAKDLSNALLAYAAQRLVEDLVEPHNLCDREAYCQDVAYNLMSQAASSAYLRSFSPEDLRRMENRARATFTLLKDTLNDEFENATWLDQESKTEVFEQLRNISLAPYNWESFLLNNTYLDDYYKQININSTNYFENAINLVLLDKKHSYSMYLKNPLLPQYVWSHFKYPYQNTGNVIYGLNTVVIPIGLLSKFSNDAPLPKYINMAGEGLVMAHELAHMFDFVGMKREFHEEHLKLSSHSTSIFKEMEMCINTEYDFKKSHPAEDGNLIVFQTNGALSANERMADYTGVLIAYSTYLKHWGDSEELLPLISSWTPDQLFFLQATQDLCSKRKIYHHFLEIFEDVHLPSAIRVENMVSNSDEFSEAFSCPKKLHCDVFPRIPDPPVVN